MPLWSICCRAKDDDTHKGHFPGLDTTMPSTDEAVLTSKQVNQRGERYQPDATSSSHNEDGISESSDTQAVDWWRQNRTSTTGSKTTSLLIIGAASQHHRRGVDGHHADNRGSEDGEGLEYTYYPQHSNINGNVSTSITTSSATTTTGGSSFSSPPRSPQRGTRARGEQGKQQRQQQESGDLKAEVTRAWQEHGKQAKRHPQEQHDEEKKDDIEMRYESDHQHTVINQSSMMSDVASSKEKDHQQFDSRATSITNQVVGQSRSQHTSWLLGRGMEASYTAGPVDVDLSPDEIDAIVLQDNIDHSLSSKAMASEPIDLDLSVSDIEGTEDTVNANTYDAASPPDELDILVFSVDERGYTVGGNNDLAPQPSSSIGDVKATTVATDTTGERMAILRLPSSSRDSPLGRRRSSRSSPPSHDGWHQRMHQQQQTVFSADDTTLRSPNHPSPLPREPASAKPPAPTSPHASSSSKPCFVRPTSDDSGDDHPPVFPAHAMRKGSPDEQKQVPSNRHMKKLHPILPQKLDGCGDGRPSTDETSGGVQKPTNRHMKRSIFCMNPPKKSANTRKSDRSTKDVQNQELEPKNEALSDIPSNIDSTTRERYLMACRLLKSALIEKESTLLTSEKTFLSNLMAKKNGSGDFPSEEQVAAIETASQTLQTDPLFKFDSLFSSALDYGVYTEDRDQAGDESSFDQLSNVASIDDSLLKEIAESKKQAYVLNTAQSFDSMLRSHHNNAGSTSEPRTAPDTRSEGRFSKASIGQVTLGVDDFTRCILTPSRIEALRGFFPPSVAEENFYLKYTRERDGARLEILLSKIRSSKYTIIAVRTKDGDVFGSFCGAPWRVQPTWFGSKADDAFLWREEEQRHHGEGSEIGAHEVHIYPSTGHDLKIQYCTRTMIAVGGGEWSNAKDKTFPGEPAGIGFLLDNDLYGGESSSCGTFANPCLCGRGNEFDIVDLEVWTLTPCTTIEAADRLEIQRLFIDN